MSTVENQLADPAMMTMLCCRNGECRAGVPEAVYTAVFRCLEDRMGRDRTRNERTAEIVPLMMAGNWRFCRCYEDGASPAHMLIYGLIRTEVANYTADILMASRQNQEEPQAFPDHLAHKAIAATAAA